MVEDRRNVFISPEGNAEIWAPGTEPEGWVSEEEWNILNPPPPPTEEELKVQRIAEIQNELAILDQQIIRPMAEKVYETASDDDLARFSELMDAKEKLREELRELTEPPKKKKKKADE